MTLERLQELIAAYGAEPRRWPEAERQPALDLLAASAAGRAALAEAAALDRALASWQVAAPETALARRILAQAEATPQPAPLWRGFRMQAPLAWLTGRRLWPELAGCAIALVLGFSIGFSVLDPPDDTDPVDVAGLVFGGGDWESLL